MAHRFSECPGPCSPRNKLCRRACVQNVMTILEELPPCIRARLRQEDLLSIFMKDHETDHAPTSAKDLATNTLEECPERADKSSKPLSSDDAPARADREEEATQTMEEKEVQTENGGAVVGVTAEFLSVGSRVRSVREHAGRASILLQDVAIRGIRFFGATRISPCSCCTITTAVYVVLLLVLAIFARHSSTYQTFLASQICGILAIISWRISGSVPF